MKKLYSRALYKDWLEDIRVEPEVFKELLPSTDEIYKL